MSTWTTEDAARFAIRRARAAAPVSAQGAGAAPVLERNPGNEAAGTSQDKGGSKKRFLVRVTSVRDRLCDTDNIVAKWTVDCVRRGGIIPDDDPATAVIEVGQRKRKPWENEHTLIEVFEIHG